jgi:molybdopterin-containing oxidoreductase family iron-sulfur binding subunit
MARWGMVIDLDRCTACQACVVACQVENNVPPTDADHSESGRAISWLRLVHHEEAEHGTRPQLRLSPVPCMHCDVPPCTKVCPVQATQIDTEGLVGQIYPRCIGCRYCTTACPYTVREFNWETPEFPQPLDQGLSPDVNTRVPAAAGPGAEPGRLDSPQRSGREVHLLPSPAAAGTGPGSARESTSGTR